MARDRRAACRSRRDSRRVADGSANLSRHTFAPSQEERRVAEATARGRLSRLQLARRRLATGVAGRQSRSLADRDHASKQGRHPRRGRLHESLRQRSSKHFLPNQFVLKILKSVAPSPTRAIEHFQDERNRAIRLFSGFYLSIGIESGRLDRRPKRTLFGHEKGKQAASERAFMERRSERAACGGQARLLNRQLSLPVSTMSQW